MHEMADNNGTARWDQGSKGDLRDTLPSDTQPSGTQSHALNPAVIPFQLGQSESIERDEPTMFGGEAKNDKRVPPRR